MSVRPIIDAGPGLSFLSINKERLLIAVLGRFGAPETVRDEVLRKSRQDDRFRAAATVWSKLTTHDWIQVLPDDVTPGLATVMTGPAPRSPCPKSGVCSGYPVAAMRGTVRSDPVRILTFGGPAVSWPGSPSYYRDGPRQALVRRLRP